MSHPPEKIPNIDSEMETETSKDSEKEKEKISKVNTWEDK